MAPVDSNETIWMSLVPEVWTLGPITLGTGCKNIKQSGILLYLVFHSLCAKNSYGPDVLTLKESFSKA